MFDVEKFEAELLAELRALPAQELQVEPTAEGEPAKFQFPKLPAFERLGKLLEIVKTLSELRNLGDVTTKDGLAVATRKLAAALAVLAALTPTTADDAAVKLLERLAASDVAMDVLAGVLAKLLPLLAVKEATTMSDDEFRFTLKAAMESNESLSA